MGEEHLREDIVKRCADCASTQIGETYCLIHSCIDKSKWRPREKIIVENKIKEEVNHPSYYMANGIEAIDVIEAFGLGFCEGSAIKYILRAGKKSSEKKIDIQKAIWYLQRTLK